MNLKGLVNINNTLIIEQKEIVTITNFMRRIVAVGGSDNWDIYKDKPFEEVISTCARNGVDITFTTRR